MSYLSWRWRCEFESRSCRYVLDTTLCQWLAAGRWISSGTHVSSTNKNDHHDTAEIFLKVALNTNTLTLTLLWIQNAKYIINSIFFSGSPDAYIHKWKIIKLNASYMAVQKLYTFIVFISVSILSTIYWKRRHFGLNYAAWGWGCRLSRSLITVIVI